MGKSAKERLSQTLNTHLESIEDTIQVVSTPPASSLEKISWDDVITISQQVSKQATIAGMLWTGDAPNWKELEENMNTYFKMLQGLLLLSHGSTIGAGPTLLSCIHTSMKQVVQCSLSLLKEAVSSYGSRSTNSKLSLPQLAGTVWDACSSMKKTPTTNYTAIGRAITQVAVSVKDVLRELKELKPASVDPEDTNLGIDAEPSQQSENDETSSEGDLGNDLSSEEFIIAQSAANFVSETLLVIKELIRFISGLLKHPNQNSRSVDSLERLLKLSQEIGLQVDNLGACLYPPQELLAIKTASDEISMAVGEIKTEVLSLEDSPDQFLQSCEGFSKSLMELGSKLGYSDATDLVAAIQKLEEENTMNRRGLPFLANEISQPSILQPSILQPSSTITSIHTSRVFGAVNHQQTHY